MGVYQLFASVYESVADMHAAYQRDRALELETSSGIITVEADSLDKAFEKMMKTPEYVAFEQRHGTIFFYYLDSQKSPCQIHLLDSGF